MDLSETKVSLLIASSMSGPVAPRQHSGFSATVFDVVVDCEIQSVFYIQNWHTHSNFRLSTKIATCFGPCAWQSSHVYATVNRFEEFRNTSFLEVFQLIMFLSTGGEPPVQCVQPGIL